MQFRSSCSSVVRAVQWFVQFGGSCSSVVHAVQWFMKFSGPIVSGSEDQAFLKVFLIDSASDNQVELID